MTIYVPRTAALPAIHQVADLSGLRPVAPSRQIEAESVEICEDATCQICHRRGLTYLPYSKPGQYRPFAACPDCGNIIEF